MARDRHDFARAQEGAGDGHDAFRTGKTVTDQQTLGAGTDYPDGATLKLAVGTDDEHEVTLLIAEHGGLRQDYAETAADLDVGARESTRPQILVGGRQRNAHTSLARRGIDDGADLPYRAREGPRDTLQANLCLLADL